MLILPLMLMYIDAQGLLNSGVYVWNNKSMRRFMRTNVICIRLLRDYYKRKQAEALNQRLNQNQAAATGTPVDRGAAIDEDDDDVDDDDYNDETWLAESESFSGRPNERIANPFTPATGNSVDAPTTTISNPIHPDGSSHSRSDLESASIISASTVASGMTDHSSLIGDGDSSRTGSGRFKGILIDGNHRKSLQAKKNSGSFKFTSSSSSKRDASNAPAAASSSTTTTNNGGVETLSGPAIGLSAAEAAGATGRGATTTYTASRDVDRRRGDSIDSIDDMDAHKFVRFGQ